MKTVFFYGDSYTWGYDPGKGTRFPYEQRWTSIVREKLGRDYTVIVEALNGRTTAFDDPFCSYRNGQFAFPMLLDSHHPIDLLVIMLGSNDCKEHLHNRPTAISWGMRSLVELARGKGYGPDGNDPAILILAPPAMIPGDQGRANFDLREFDGAAAKASELAKEYKKIAAENNCFFLDTAPAAPPSPIDGLHLSVESNKTLGEWIAPEILKLPF
jgi:lysophospholipase L1-like esterase